MEISVGVLLHKYSSGGSEGSVCHDEEGFGSVWHSDYWGAEEHFFESYEHAVLFLSPQEGSPLFGQIVKWSGKCGEVRDEFSIEVAEPDERSDCFYQSGWFPLFHGPEFGRVHVYFSILDHQSQVLHLHLVEGAFGQLKV